MFQVNAGDNLTISTVTPPGAPGTTTDNVPRELFFYDPNGNLVATASDNAADGKNAVIQSTALVSGVYKVGISSPESGASIAGEYGLAVQGDTGGFANVAVTATSPAAGSAVEHFTDYVVTFNQPVYVPSLSAGELTIGGMPALSVRLINGRTVDWTINQASLPKGTGLVTPILSADAAGRRIEGVNLTSLAQVSTSFQTGPITLSQFQPVQPLEGMVYDTTATGSLAYSSVVDTYYVSINPSQTLAVIATPLTANMSATVTLISPTGQTIGSATSPAAGKPALLPGTRSLGGGTYTIQVSGGAGQYRLVAYLNAYIDPSGYGGAANNSIASATPIDPYATRFIGHDDRTAVLGQEIAGDLNPVYSFALDQGESASVALSSPNGKNVSFAIYDSSGDLVALSHPGATNYAQGLNEFIAPADGAYFVRVSGNADAQFNLVVTRGADLSATGNNSLFSAQDITATERSGDPSEGGVLGYLTNPSQSIGTDYYVVNANAGDNLLFATSTPSGGPAAFQNGLYTELLLFDPSGNLVAVAAGNAADGRNSIIDFTVPQGDSGHWTIEVTPSQNTPNPTQGEYGLLASGATGTLPAFYVASTNPAPARSWRPRRTSSQRSTSRSIFPR